MMRLMKVENITSSPQQLFYGCGATLLTCEKDRQPIVVTAAHCVPRYRLGPITVKLRTPKYVACGKAANLNINGVEPVEHILVSYYMAHLCFPKVGWMLVFTGPVSSVERDGRAGGVGAAAGGGAGGSTRGLQ